ncbi:uncharacterized protein LOC124545783 [Schistocerca americana]|uniref:uncharacterized protein LOC124545783 n=1 Tax=Schistocerca americana TaxID=7009 RepID=UPI001F4F613B|nr:uncharacterized protein LOC124545783 [Schistocerca americana]
MTSTKLAALLSCLLVTSTCTASNKTKSSAEGRDLKDEVAPRMMVDLTHEAAEFVPQADVLPLQGAILLHDAARVYGHSGAFFGPHTHAHAHGLLASALVLPGATPISYGSGMPLIMGGIRTRPGGSHKVHAGVTEQGESENLLVKLTMSSALRDNLVTVFGYLLYQTRWPKQRDHYTSFLLVFQAVRLRHISTLDLLPVLKKASAERPSSQMLLILRHMRKSSPRYLTGAVDEVIASVSASKDVIDDIIQPRGGPLVVDFLAGIESKYLAAGERPISFGKTRIDSSVVSLMGSTFGQIYSALADGTLPLTQPLFAALLLHLPRDFLNPQADEFMRMLVDLLRLETLENWSNVIGKIRQKDKQKPFVLARFVLKTIAKDSKTSERVREATLVVLHHVKEPEITFSLPHYSVLSPIVSKPNIDLVSLLQTITYPEYPEDVVDVKNRIVYYVQHGYLNLDLITKGFMRYDHVRPLDLIIALLTRITTNMPKLPAEIIKSVESLTVHLKFKELGCSMASHLPENFIDLPSLTHSFLSPSLPLIVQQTAEKALKVIFQEFPEDMNKLLPSIPVEMCIRPRMCLHTIMTKAIESNVFKTKVLFSTADEFLRTIENLTDVKYPTPTKSGESNFPTSPTPSAASPVPQNSNLVTTITNLNSTSTPQREVSRLIKGTSSRDGSTAVTAPSATKSFPPSSIPHPAVVTGSAITKPSNNGSDNAKSYTPPVSPITTPSPSSLLLPPVSETELPKIEKGPHGKPVFPKGTNGKPTFHTSPQGRPVLITGSDGKPIFPTGPDGNPIHPAAPNGQPLFVKGLDGKTVIPFTSDGKPIYPETPEGKPIVPTAADGNPVFPTNSNGAPILPVRHDGKPIFPVDADGMPIAPKGSDGRPVFTVGLDGRLIFPTGQDKLPKIPLGIDGNPIFVLGPQPLLAVVLSPDGKPYSTGIPGTIYNGMSYIHHNDIIKGNTTVKVMGEVAPTALPKPGSSKKIPEPKTAPTLENVLTDADIQKAISQIPKDVPLPSPSPVDEQLPILPGNSLDYLLPPTLPGSPEDLRLRPLRILLSMPKLTAHLITAINIGAFKTRGDLLRAVLMYLVKMEEVKRIQLLLEDLQFYLKRLQGEDGQAPKLLVNWEGLISALPIPSSSEEAKHFQIIKAFLEPMLSHKLGSGFDPMKYKLKGTLLKQLFEFSLSQKFVSQTPGLREAIEFYISRIMMHGYGAQPVEYIILKQTLVSKTVNLNSLFKALDTSKFDSRGKKAYKNMFKFFTTEFDVKKHFTGFDFTRYNKKGLWLKKFLEFLSRSVMIPAERRTDFKYLISYVIMDGEGDKSVEYVE